MNYSFDVCLISNDFQGKRVVGKFVEGRNLKMQNQQSRNVSFKVQWTWENPCGNLFALESSTTSSNLELKEYFSNIFISSKNRLSLLRLEKCSD